MDNDGSGRITYEEMAEMGGGSRTRRWRRWCGASYPNPNPNPTPNPTPNPNPNPRCGASSSWVRHSFPKAR
eukprot:scaffold93379_cov29-Phaeocystis_antarctica.AAC.1